MNILLTSLNNLGDVIMSTGAIRLLRENFPDAKIDILLRPETAEVMRCNPDINEVIVYPYKSRRFFHKLRETVAAVRKRRYDVSLSLDRRSRSAWVAFLARIPKRVGTHILFRGCRPASWTRLLYTGILPMSASDCDVVVEMFHIVMRRAFSLSGSRPVRPLSAPATGAEAVFAGAMGPVIGLSVRANFILKTWPPDKFAMLANRLHADLGAFLYITGAPADWEYADELLRQCPEGTALNVAGKTSVMDMVALAARSDLFITLDTGALHIAANSGVPRILGLFFCTCPENLNGALPKSTKILWSGEKCSPCYHVKPHECLERPCIRRITVDMVYDAAVKLLAENAQE